MKTYKEKEQKRYDIFITELELLSKKYGVLLNATGAVFVVPQNEKEIKIEYSNDYLSGDLNYRINKE
jgi:hypothetical protein